MNSSLLDDGEFTRRQLESGLITSLARCNSCRRAVDRENWYCLGFHLGAGMEAVEIFSGPTWSDQITFSLPSLVSFQMWSGGGGSLKEGVIWKAIGDGKWELSDWVTMEINWVIWDERVTTWVIWVRRQLPSLSVNYWCVSPHLTIICLRDKLTTVPMRQHREASDRKMLLHAIMA